MGIVLARYDYDFAPTTLFRGTILLEGERLDPRLDVDALGAKLRTTSWTPFEESGSLALPMAGGKLSFSSPPASRALGWISIWFPP